MPAVAAARDAAQRRDAVAADQQRRVRPLERLRRGEGVLEGEVRPRVGGGPVRPQRLHHVDALVADGAARVVVDAQRLVLLGHRADTDADIEAAARHHVDRRELPGEGHRVQVGQHQHAGAEAHALGAGGHPGEQRQRVPVRLEAQPLADVAGVEDVVRDPDGGKARLLGPRGEVQQVLGILDAPVVGQCKAESHGGPPPGAPAGAIIQPRRGGGRRARVAYSPRPRTDRRRPP